MLTTLTTRDHVLVARGASSGAIAGSIVGAVAAAVLILVCSLPFILKCRRKRRLRQRQEEDAKAMHAVPGAAAMRSRPQSQAFATHANRLSHMSNSRLASAAATLSDHDSQTGKEYGPDGITYHRSAAPSPALVGQAMLSCSPAPSVILASSRKNSPAVVQGPFTPPPEPGIGSRSATFGTLTSEPEQLSRSPTGSQHGSMGDAFRKIHDKILHRDTTRSSGSESRQNTRSSDMDLDELTHAQTGASAPYLVDEKPVMGGSAEEYYSAATAALAGVVIPRAQQGGDQQSKSRSLGSPFDPPMSPESDSTKDDDASSEEGGRETPEAKRDTLSPPHRGLHPSSPNKAFEPPPSPSHPEPGTVNPMEMMKPSIPAEQAAWVNTELWKLDNSPPHLDTSPPHKTEPSPTSNSHTLPPYQQQHHQQQQQQEPTPPLQTEPYYQEPESYQDESDIPQQQPTPVPDRPQFQAVVRHPTQMDITTSGQILPQHEEQVITDISDTSSPGPGYDQYAYAPSPSNHTSPDTRFTDSAYTGSPSPRSSMNSQRPPSSYNGTDYHLGAVPGGHSRNSSQGENSSPKPTSFACEECGSRFDQVHKLNHHKRYHERPHQCSLCDKRFGTKTHLDRHVNDKHNKTRKYHCTVAGCAYAKQGGGKSFPRKDNWRRHMQNKHSVQNPPEPLEEDVTMEDAANLVS
ncbi:hypothetical protein N0V93_009379 [Gnomoniopsis smithogilvyi]|uniref:C2H2-type domain-containing protein n=1 Tax=Gnomoniopsis smithogilvyi TaxID=1191159 RepID=A0A9W8YN19_9PEZI|nr:hypothetical protein N0V93_009379 [Gnomoniopsis smithogilvyi]